MPHPSALLKFFARPHPPGRRPCRAYVPPNHERRTRKLARQMYSLKNRRLPPDETNSRSTWDRRQRDSGATDKESREPPILRLAELSPLVEQGREVREAVMEVLAINLQLLRLWREQQRGPAKRAKRQRRAKRGGAW